MINNMINNIILNKIKYGEICISFSELNTESEFDSTRYHLG